MGEHRAPVEPPLPTIMHTPLAELTKLDLAPLGDDPDATALIDRHRPYEAAPAPPGRPWWHWVAGSLSAALLAAGALWAATPDPPTTGSSAVAPDLEQPPPMLYVPASTTTTTPPARTATRTAPRFVAPPVVTTTSAPATTSQPQTTTTTPCLPLPATHCASGGAQ